MKYFDKKTEKQTWLYIFFVIPIGVLILWKKNAGIGLKEIIILLIASVVAVGMLYFIKWISNR